MTQTAEIEKTEEYRALETPIDGIIRAVAARIGGDKSKEFERFFKFAIVGMIGAIVDFGTLNLLQATILPPPSDSTNFSINVAIAVSISFIAAVVSNFTWNRYWTYPDSRTRSIRRQLSQFAVVSFVGWLGRTLWVSFAFGFMGRFIVSLIQTVDESFDPSLLTQNRLGTNAALLVGVSVVMLWNFFVNRYWTYNDVD